MKSLWKWCTVAGAVALFAVWGSQAQDSGWNIQSVASGPDAGRQRVLEMDVAVQSHQEFDVVYISYIDQAAKAVKLLQIEVKEEEGQIKTAITARTGIERENRVAGTTVAVDGKFVCVAWEELGDVHEIWQACWEKPLENDEAPSYGPWRMSTEGALAGQADGAGWGEFGLNFDNTFAPDGTLYAVWSEEYSELKAARVLFTDEGPQQEACGDLPDSADVIRYPTVYVDNDGGVWVASADLSYPPGPDIYVWYSTDQCDSWTQRVNVTPTGLYSDGAGIVRLGNKIYVVNDDDAGAAPGTADIHVNTCDVTAAGPDNCVRSVVHQHGGFPHIATDGKGLYVTSTNENQVLFSYSCDAGGSWTPAHIPNGYHLGFRDPDFGAALSRIRIAVDRYVYVVWFWRSEGRSNIMLAILPKPCQ